MKEETPSSTPVDEAVEDHVEQEQPSPDQESQDGFRESSNHANPPATVTEPPKHKTSQESAPVDDAEKQVY